ncbi:SDR family NAD(P)-dependent oxidoreductase [Pseudomonas sp. NPDC089752]|uniref:SDR family NAD(P)-dependent oxidoreductase n=1 Tax=Pseudomonas sp. NPDC089752 TaxID=3364472 RepID=UPI0038077D4B
MSSSEKTAFITGAGSGIGEAAALAFASSGVAVAVGDLDIVNAEKVATKITCSGGLAKAFAIDVSCPQSVESAFESAESWYGVNTSILVNSAGIMGVHEFLGYPAELFSKVMAVNVTGAFLCAQRASRNMAKAGVGRIINIASVSAERAGIGRAAYGTSKAALVGLTRQMAMELGPLGITSNAVAPGPVITPLTQASYNAATIDAYESMIPARRLGLLNEITSAIIYLASDDAAYINGVFLPVDGGYLAGGVAKTGKLS